MTTTDLSASGLRAGRREWAGLAVLALPTLLLSLDMSVLYLALPHLSADLGASSTQQLWIMDIYGFMIAGFLVTMGTLGDRVGRRRLLMIGAGAFGIASVLAAYASSAEMLIASRALLGIAGATLMPSTLALISNMFRDARQRGIAVAAWISCFMGGMAIGPVIGGLLLANFWWGAAFLLGVPVMVILLIAAPILLPEFRNTGAARLDPTSVAMSLAAILPVIYGLKELAKHGVGAGQLTALAVGGAFGLAFVIRQRRLTNPLLDMRLFSNRTFSAALGLNLVVGAIMGGGFLLVNLYLQMVVGLEPLEAGLWLAPPAVLMIVSNNLAPRLARRIRPVRLMAGGMLVAAAGWFLITQVDGSGSLALLLAGISLMNIGMGPMIALGFDLILGSVPPEKAGAASSISETSAEFGIAMGIAALGSVGTAIYHAQVVPSIPAGLPAEAAAVAGESLAGAVNVAGTLPAGAASELMTGAADAFTSGLNLVAAVAAVLFVGIAGVVSVLFRDLVTGAGSEPEDVSAPAEPDGRGDDQVDDQVDDDVSAPAGPDVTREPVLVS